VAMQKADIGGGKGAYTLALLEAAMRALAHLSSVR